MVNRLELTSRGEREVVITRAFDAARDRVFAAYTEPRLVRRWLLGPPGWTMPVCEIDARAGGTYRYVWEGPGDERLGLSGTFGEVVPPARITSSETFDEDWTGGATEIVMGFAADGPERTIVTQTIRYASAEARAGALATGMADGLEAGFARLDALLPEFAGDA